VALRVHVREGQPRLRRSQEWTSHVSRLASRAEREAQTPLCGNSVDARPTHSVAVRDRCGKPLLIACRDRTLRAPVVRASRRAWDSSSVHERFSFRLPMAFRFMKC